MSAHPDQGEANQLLVENTLCDILDSMQIGNPLDMVSESSGATSGTAPGTTGTGERMPDGQGLYRPQTGGYARLRDVIHSKSLLREGTFKLSSGQTTNYFFNMKTTMLDPEGANLIADAILNRLADERVDAIGGLAMGAVPIVSVVCAKSLATGNPIPAFFVRKEMKGHGTDNLVEGHLTPGSRAIVVDDVTTTGSSVLKAVMAAREAGCQVDTVITVVDRLEGAEANLRRQGISLVALYTRRDFEPQG